MSNSSYNSSYALLLAFATSFFAYRRISLYSCLLSSSLCISHLFFANLFFRMLSCTSSSHHQVSLLSFLCFDDTPSTFLAVSLYQYDAIVERKPCSHRGGRPQGSDLYVVIFFMRTHQYAQHGPSMSRSCAALSVRGKLPTSAEPSSGYSNNQQRGNAIKTHRRLFHLAARKHMVV